MRRPLFLARRAPARRVWRRRGRAGRSRRGGRAAAGRARLARALSRRPGGAPLRGRTARVPQGGLVGGDRRRRTRTDISFELDGDDTELQFGLMLFATGDLDELEQAAATAACRRRASRRELSRRRPRCSLRARRGARRSPRAGRARGRQLASASSSGLQRPGRAPRGDGAGRRLDHGPFVPPLTPDGVVPARQGHAAKEERDGRGDHLGEEEIGSEDERPDRDVGDADGDDTDSTDGDARRQ